MLSTFVGILATGLFAVIGWAFQTSNRLTAVEREIKVRQEDLPKYLDAKFESIEQRLDRIERSLNGSLHA